jgi:hypothetical protein
MTNNDYNGQAKWDWIQLLTNVLQDRAAVGDHIKRYGWHNLPAAYQRNYPDRDPTTTGYGLTASAGQRPCIRLFGKQYSKPHPLTGICWFLSGHTQQTLTHHVLHTPATMHTARQTGRQ